MSDLDVFEITKHSTEIRTRSVDFDEKVPTGVTISSATIAAVELPTLTDRASTVLQSTTGTVSGTTVSFIAKAGTSGTRYKITVTATLSSGDKLVAIVFMTIKDF